MDNVACEQLGGEPCEFRCGQLRVVAIPQARRAPVASIPEPASFVGEFPVGSESFVLGSECVHGVVVGHLELCGEA